jgi:hypothetical protein
LPPSSPSASGGGSFEHGSARRRPDGTAYATALVTLAMLYVGGTTLGVRLSAGDWVAMTWLLLVGLVPFAALGIMLGQVVSADTVGPAIGGATALLGLLGGTCFPITGHGAMHRRCESRRRKGGSSQIRFRVRPPSTGTTAPVT